MNSLHILSDVWYGFFWILQEKCFAYHEIVLGFLVTLHDTMTGTNNVSVYWRKSTENAKYQSLEEKNK